MVIRLTAVISLFGNISVYLFILNQEMIDLIIFRLKHQVGITEKIQLRVA